MWVNAAFVSDSVGWFPGFVQYQSLVVWQGHLAIAAS